MGAAITRKTFAQITMIGATVLGCATARRDSDRNQSPSIPFDPSLTSLARPGSDRLTAAELAAAPGYGTGTAYDVLARLRPHFLNPRVARGGIIASGGLLPAVLVDGTYHGGLEALRTIPASAVVEIQYVRAMDAMHRYGPSFQAGAILVHLRR